MKKAILVIIIFHLGLTIAVSQEYLDSAVTWSGGENAYFFSGNEYISFNFENTNASAGNPKTVEDSTWPGVSFSKIDAALNWGNGKIYFFSGDQYIRFDIARGNADAGYPKEINDRTWPGLSFSTVDAAVTGGNGKAYFFSGSKYIQYDIKSDRADFSSPKEISSFWKNVPFNKIDAAVRSGNLIHLFSGYETIAYNLKNGYSIQDAPSSIKNWNGLTHFSASPAEIIASPEPEIESGSDNINSGFSIEKFEVSVSPPVHLENTVLAWARIIALKSGSYVLAYNNRDTVFFIELDSSFQKRGFEKEYRGYWFSEMIPAEDGGFYITLGKDVNNTYIEGYPNTIFAGKLDSDGTEQYLTYIFGGKGHGPLTSWFDGRSKATLTEGNNELGVYFEVQKNWSETSEEDIHNGDMFAVLDSRGKMLDERTHFWTASHSSTIQTAFGANGDFYTMTIGDAYPYGLQFYNRDEDQSNILWPPDEDYVTYEEVNSTNAAGILEKMIPAEDGFIAVMGTLEHPNIGVFDKVDVMFLKTDFIGNVTAQRWLTRTPGKDESIISIIPWGDDYLTAWGKGNDYDNNWKAGNISLSVVDAFGETRIEAEELEYPLGTYSHLTSGLDDSAVWVYCDNGDSSVKIFQIKD